MSDMNDLTEDSKRGLKAFKKRLKMHQREEDSRLGRAKTTGQHNAIVAIRPPSDVTPEMLQELIDKKYLTPDGGNFFKLAPGK